MTASSSSSDAAGMAATLIDALARFRGAAAACLKTEGGPAAAAGAVEELLQVAVRLSAASLGSSALAPITELGTALTPTEVAVVCIHLLDQAELDLFELAMWKNWGRP